MKIQGLSPLKQFAAIGVSASVLLLAFWVGGASAAPKVVSPGTDLAVGAPAASGGVAVTAPGMAMPSIGLCCPGSASSGLTTSGQGSVQGQGAAARDEAIAKAIADATEQAKAAAKDAGITLGPIVGMQVSAPSYAYPVPVMEGPGGTSVSIGKVTGVSSGAGVIAPDAGATSSTGGSAPGAPGVPGPVETFASVTITWSIA